ncbi:metalloregulator ArsR/SmtB family transcription factor [Serratia fonticola]|uniref:ArsR/SmtB family transcription factor n=1 Tax=Serratia fonticola TaxID=47917 RepID=UPI001376634D|nr:metalloregulator ArsR/SmtB family transcription factor [Serratia fonticola]NBJ35182.1 metalloregulator ArsR/SmtB family transcription factor [Serratia fonticola]
MTDENASLLASANAAATLLKAMSNPRRLQILCMLVDTPGTSAGELALATGLSPSATSQHLAKMREEGLIESTRDRQRINYSIKNSAVQQVISTLKAIYCP